MILKSIIKAHVIIAAFVSLSVFSSCGGKTKTAAQAYFQDSVYHLGILTQGDLIRSFDFKYTNVGDSDLVVYSVEPSCECLTVSFEQKYLHKGDTASIHVTFNGEGEAAEAIYRNIMVYTNASLEPYILDIYGEIR